MTKSEAMTLLQRARCAIHNLDSIEHPAHGNAQAVDAIYTELQYLVGMAKAELGTDVEIYG